MAPKDIHDFIETVVGDDHYAKQVDRLLINDLELRASWVSQLQPYGICIHFGLSSSVGMNNIGLYSSSERSLA